MKNIEKLRKFSKKNVAPGSPRRLLGHMAALEAPGGLWRPSEAPGATRRLQEAHGSTWVLLKATRHVLELPGGPHRLLDSRRGTWRRIKGLAATSGTWTPLADPGGLWQPLDASLMKRARALTCVNQTSSMRKKQDDDFFLCQNCPYADLNRLSRAMFSTCSASLLLHSLTS